MKLFKVASHSDTLGPIHVHPSRVRVGRGSDEIGQPSSLAGAVTPKPPINAEKAECYGRTNGWNDGRTDQRTERVKELRAHD